MNVYFRQQKQNCRERGAMSPNRPNPEIGATIYAYVHPSGFNALV
jgi:hypothetical protein